jgi:hypothetical protein
MKSIQKISIILAIMLITTHEISYAPSRGNSGGGGGTRSGGTSHSSNSSSNTALKGGAAVHSQNKQSQDAGGMAAAAGMASQNSQDSASGGSSPSSAATPAATNPMPTGAPTSEQQAAAPMANTNVPTSINNQANQPTKPDVNSPQADQINPNDKVETPEQEQAEQDRKTIAPDQDEILEQLKTIDLADNKVHSLLSMAAMDQLFNNFVYFKNFIVQNFAKDKMMRLAVEFISQIYPKEHIATMHMAPTKPDPTAKTNTQEASAADHSAPQAVTEEHTSAIPSDENNDNTLAQSADHSANTSEESSDQHAAPDTATDAAPEYHDENATADSPNQSIGDDQAAS